MKQYAMISAAMFAVLAVAACGEPAEQSQTETAVVVEAPAWLPLVDSYVQQGWTAQGPGASVVIMQGGEIVYQGQRGLADLDSGTAITSDTVFRLASLSKQYAAAVILQLVDEEAISLDDRLSDFLPDYPQPGASATLRQLLNHTSGVMSYTSIEGWMSPENLERDYTTDEMIAEFADIASVTPPGEAWAYNNSGYVLVGAVIETVTGQSWHEAIIARIGEPLGLSSLAYGGIEAQIATMASGYTRGEDGPVPSITIDMSVPHAAGALIGTAADMALWNDALHHGRVVSSQSYAAMTAPSVLPDGEQVDYGFGIGSGAFRGHRTLNHGGGIPGFSTYSLFLPEEDVSVVIFANSDSGSTSPSDVSRMMAAAVIGDPFPVFEAIEVDMAAIAPLLGGYYFEDWDTLVEFLEVDGGLVERIGERDTPVYAIGDNRFFYGPLDPDWFEISRLDDGQFVYDFYDDGEDEYTRGVRIEVDAGPEAGPESGPEDGPEDGPAQNSADE